MLLYLDVSLVPEVIARVIKKWIDKEELVLAGIQIIGTIAQSMVWIWRLISRSKY